MLPFLGRAVDRFLSRGEGLDEHGDPFGPPVDAAEAERLLRAIREAPAASEPPFPSPLAPPGGGTQVGVRRFGAGPRWVVVAPHYGSLAHPTRLGVTGALVRALTREGLGVAVPEGPYHGARAMPGRPSGWGFVRADLGATTRAFAASACEVASLVRRLREVEGASWVGGVGVSLGGVAVGLCAATGPRFDAVAFLAAVDNPAGFYATGENREARRRTLAKAGYDHARVAEAFRPLAPSTHAAPAARRLWVVPEQDLVVPAATQRAWHAAWGGGLETLRRHGHATALSSPLVAARIAAWMAQEKDPAGKGPAAPA